MLELAAPVLTVMVVLPLLVALVPRPSRGLALAAAGIELALSGWIAWELHSRAGAGALVDPWAGPLLLVDELSSLLLPFATLLFAFVLLAAPRTWSSYRGALATEAIVLATFLTTSRGLLALLWATSALSAHLALRSRAVSLYMAATVVLFTLGVAIPGEHAGIFLLAAVLIRKGIFPFHSWVLPLFERMPLPSAALFAAPQLAAYATVRLIVPSASSDLLSLLGLVSLATALYGAGLSLVQTDVRRALGAFVMSQSALVMAGLESRNVIGLAGGLALWISTGLALAGFTLVVAALEARRGSLTLARHQGGYDRTPLVAVSFLLLGLASVGFPGTLGFAGEEALVHGAFTEAPLRGALALLAASLNGITVMRCYFLLFCGSHPRLSATKKVRPRERVAFFALVAILLVGGLFPQRFLASREKAAEEILRENSRP